MSRLKTPAGVPGWLYWSPRMLGVLFALFLAVFALDVFGEYHDPGQILVALFMHLLPTTILVGLIVAIAWRWEWIGTVTLLGLAIAYPLAGKHDISAILLISGSLAVVGTLFGVSGWVRAHPRSVAAEV